MDQLITVVIILLILFVLFGRNNNKENFFFYKTPPLLYDAESCGRRCDNTSGCQSYYYDPVTRQCHMNSHHRYGDLYYPYVNNTYWWTPSRYRWGKYVGEIARHQRPKIPAIERQ